MNKSYKFDANMVKYIVEDTTSDSSEFAALNLNPTVRWAKFILTDDEPNQNKVRIPESEFSNLIKTGVFMPLKVAAGEISEGHENTFAIGVITHLKKVKNKIEGLAVLWSKERPEDVDMLKTKYDNREPIDLSWEIEYADSVTNEETGIKDLLGTKLRALTIVGIPAYAGRTPITAFASKTNQEDSKLEELKRLQDELAVANGEKASLISELALLKEQVTTLTTELAETKTDAEELEVLRTFKKEVDELKAKLEKVAAIKDKFSEAGLNKSEEYFTDNIEKLLEMSEETLDFMVQELVAFSATTTVEEEEHSSLPRIDGTGPVSIKDLAKFLRAESQK